jgi:hypothetical protein
MHAASMPDMRWDTCSATCTYRMLYSMAESHTELLRIPRGLCLGGHHVTNSSSDVTSILRRCGVNLRVDLDTLKAMKVIKIRPKSSNVDSWANVTCFAVVTPL